MNKKIKGFTIVELLVVMTVIGVIISLSIVGIQALQRSQRETQRTTDLNNIKGLLESYYNQYNRYPSIGNSSANSEIRKNNSTNKFEIGTGTDVNFNLFNSVSNQALGATIAYTDIFTTTYSGTTCNSGAFVSNPDSWWILYRASGSSPQTYSLFGCTEFGKTLNLGSKEN